MHSIERRAPQVEPEPRLNGGGPPARPLDFVFLLRPALMVPMWVFVAQGARLPSAVSWGFEVRLVPGAGEVLALLAMTGVLGGAYILNQIVDIESDRVNSKLFLLPRGIISRRAAILELAVSWTVGLLAALLLGPWFAGLAAAALLISVTYSLRPIQAKARPGLDILWNALGFGCVATLCGLAVTRLGAGAETGAWSIGAATVLPVAAANATWSVAAYATAVAGVTASTVIPDREGDERGQLRTTAVVLGDRMTSLLSVVLLAGATLLGVAARDPVAAGASGVACVAAVIAHRSGRREVRVRLNQVAVAAYALLAGVFSPYLLALVAAVTLGSRAYYRRRFGFAYPGPDGQRVS